MRSIFASLMVVLAAMFVGCSSGGGDADEGAAPAAAEEAAPDAPMDADGGSEAK